VANLGDFAEPGTLARHQHYLGLAAPLSDPNVCLIGNHDLEAARGTEAWDAVHGPTNHSPADLGATGLVYVRAHTCDGNGLKPCASRCVCLYGHRMRLEGLPRREARYWTDGRPRTEARQARRTNAPEERIAGPANTSGTRPR
jgi:hypothetical protein